MSYIFLVITLHLFVLLLATQKARKPTPKFLEPESWEVKKTNETLFNALVGYKLFLRSLDLDDKHLHSCYEYKVQDEITGVVTQSSTFCYPSIIVSGVRKCSTSATYSLLTQYPNTIVTYKKENCVYIDGLSIIEFFETLPKEITGNQILIDGCIDIVGNRKLRSILHNPKTFYLILVRDYADWTWSAYNYWCNYKYEKDCSNKIKGANVAKDGVHIRTPEIMHEIVLATQSESEIVTNYSFSMTNNICTYGNNRYRKTITTFWRETPLENTLVIASEDLEHSPEYVWHRISKAIGLNTKHPKLDEFGAVRYNTQIEKTKGLQKKVSATTYTPGLYLISKFQPLLNETRKILDKCWDEDCLWTSLVTGHEYSACSTKFQQLQVSAFDSLSASTKGDQKGIENSKKYIEKMLVNNDSSATTAATTSLSMYQRDRNKCALTLSNYRGKYSGEPQGEGEDNEITAKKGEKAPVTAILMVTKNEIDALNIKHLLQKYFLTLSFYPMETSSNKVTDPGICSTSSNGIINVVLKNNEIVLKPAKDLPGYFNLAFGKKIVICDYQRKTNNIVFKNIMFMVRDPLVQLYKDYLNFMSMKATVISNVDLDYSKWDSFALSELSRDINNNDNNNKNAKSKSLDRFYKWKENLSILDVMDSHNVHITSMEELLFSPKRIQILATLLSFIHNKRQSHLDAMVDYMHPTDRVIDYHNCVYRSVWRNISMYTEYNRVKSLISLSYSSPSVLEKLQQLYDKYSLRLEDILMLEYKSNSNNNNNVNNIIDNNSMCKLRYEKLRLSEKIQNDTYALIMPSTNRNVIHIRLLIDHAMGIYSSSMTPDLLLTGLFPQEDNCGRKNSVLYIDSAKFELRVNRQKVTFSTKSASSKNKNNNKDNNNDNNNEKSTDFGELKCVTRGADRGIFIITDPFEYLYDEYMTQYKTEDERKNHDIHTIKDIMLKLVSNYNIDNELGGVLNTLTKEKESNEVIVASYLSLLQNYDKFDPSNENAPLMQLVKEMNIAKVYKERVECAYHFIRLTEDETNRIQTIRDFYSTKHELICAVNKILATTRLKKFPFKLFRLFDEIKC